MLSDTPVFEVIDGAFRGDVNRNTGSHVFCDNHYYYFSFDMPINKVIKISKKKYRIQK